MSATADPTDIGLKVEQAIKHADCCDECTADARCDCNVIKRPHILRDHWVPEP